MTGYLQIKLNALLVLLASSIQKAKTNDTVICQEEKNVLPFVTIQCEKMVYS